MFGDTGLEYEWKTLVENLTEYKQLAWKNCEFAYSNTKFVSMMDFYYQICGCPRCMLTIFTFLHFLI